MYTLVKYDKEEILGRILYLACITNSDIAVRNFFSFYLQFESTIIILSKKTKH
jgi:hypothetical protein